MIDPRSRPDRAPAGARSRPGLGRPALFLDRDGTLMQNLPYNGDPDAVVLELGVASALARVARAGFALVVVSNQSGVARGLYTEAAVNAVNARLASLLRPAGVELDAFYYCPHHPDFGPACDCRKPEPGLLLRAARERSLDLSRSIIVGDAARDLEAGRRAGTRAIGYAPPRDPAHDFAPGTLLCADWSSLASEILNLDRKPPSRE